MQQEVMYIQQPQPQPQLQMSCLTEHESIVQLNNNQVFYVGALRDVTAAGDSNRMYRVDLHGPKENEFIISIAFHSDGSMPASIAHLLGLESGPSIVKIIKAARFKSLSMLKKGDQLVLRNGAAVVYSHKAEYAPFDIKTGRFHTHIVNPDYREDGTDEPETLLLGLYDESGNCISNKKTAIDETFFSDIVGIFK